MSDHITTELVEGIAKHSVAHAERGCPWDVVDPLVQYGIRERVLEFLKHAVPVLLEQGWQPPAAGAKKWCPCPDPLRAVDPACETHGFDIPDLRAPHAHD